MILIADSGSTKTDWCLIEKGHLIRQIGTEGFNPFFETPEEIERKLSNGLLPQLPSEPLEAVYFYGAGCTPEKAPQVCRSIGSVLKVSGTLEAHSDMLAAARSTCGREAGIACILGTGSNSCFYDGQTMRANVSPLGFILGDEGSGAVLGKLLVGDLLKNQLPAVVKEAFLKQVGLTPAQIIDRVYRQPFPNRFLASLSPFLAQQLEHPAVYDLVRNSFSAFLKRNVMQYDYRRYPTHFVGSVAYHYREILLAAAQEAGVETGLIRKSPMEGLIRFHQDLP